MSQVIGPYTTTPGQRRQYKSWQLWAEDGLVFMENQDHGDVKMLTCNEAMEKLFGFAEEADIWDKKKENADPQARAYAHDYHRYIKGLVETLRDTISDARQQGDPTDETVRKHKLRLFLRGKWSGTGQRNTLETLGALFGSGSPEPIIFQPGSPWLARGPKGVDKRH